MATFYPSWQKHWVHVPVGKREEHLVSNIQELLVVFDHVLADTHSNDPSPDEANITGDIVCDICGADIFQGFLECRICVEVDSAESR